MLEPRPPRQIDDTIPKELERICLKALSKRASDRYNTALDMSEDEISQALDVDIWTASAGLAELKAWYDAAQSEFKSVGVFTNDLL